MQSPFFVCKKLGNSEFCAILVHFFDIKKVSQVYFTITYEIISAEGQGFGLLFCNILYYYLIA